jgi:tungstate transport system substrate-binding protein
MKRRVFLAVLVAAMAVRPFVAAFAQEEIIFATTTSVQDTGLLDVIVPIFEKQSGAHVKAVAVGTGQALAMAAKGEADVVLAHAPDAEKKYVADGVLTNRRLVMHNWFLLAGPTADPAKIKGTAKAVDALKKIADAKAVFVSRGDDSGTHKLEKKLWEQASVKPAGEWYLEAGQGMGKTLGIAGEKQGYVLSDRATYLAFQKTTGLAILLEGDPAFLNVYHVIEVNSEKFTKVNAKGGKAFADFLLSATVQDLLKTFGKEKFGEPLFNPDAGKTEEAVIQQARQ